MSQTVCFMTVGGVFVEEILGKIIDERFERDELIQYVQETVVIERDQDYDCEIEHYEIGEGESGSDYFLVEEEELVAWYKEGGFNLVEQKVKEQGFDMEFIQDWNYCVTADELEVDEDEDED